MRRLLDINNPVMRFLANTFDLMGLSVLWVVFSLPIVTMGAASAALYSAVYHHVRRGEDYLLNSFWTAFKENLKRSTLCWLVALAILAVLTADALVFRTMVIRNQPMSWGYYVALMILALAMTWTVYLSAYAARFDGTAKEVLRFSFLLFRAHPVKTGAVLVLVLGGIALALVLPAMVVFIPGVVYWGATYPIESVFLQHMRPEDVERVKKEEA